MGAPQNAALYLRVPLSSQMHHSPGPLVSSLNHGLVMLFIDLDGI